MDGEHTASFTPNLVLESGVVGNHGSSLVGIRDINQVDLTLRRDRCGHCEQADALSTVSSPIWPGFQMATSTLKPQRLQTT